MRTWKSLLGVLALSVVSLATVDACAPAAEDMVGHMMVDAGNLLIDAGRDANRMVDAGRALVDAGSSMVDAGRDARSDAAAQDPVNANGSRIELRRTTQTGSDGTRYAVPWLTYYDTQLNVTCAVSKMSDGSMRCVPTNTAFNTLFFSDPGCSARLAYFIGVDCPAPQPQYFAEYVTEAAPACIGFHVRLYRAGAPHDGTIYTRSGTNCADVTATFASMYRFVAVGAEILPSDLVGFTESDDAI